MRVVERIETMLVLYVPEELWTIQENEDVCRFSVEHANGAFAVYIDGSRYCGTCFTLEDVQTRLQELVRSETLCHACRCAPESLRACA